MHIEDLSIKSFKKLYVTPNLKAITNRILPNKWAGHVRKGMSDSEWITVRFRAFQRWFQIENRTIINETV